MANPIRRLVGEALGEYGPEGTQNRWHFPSFRTGCYYGRKRDCCPVCLWRLARYEERFDRESVSVDVCDPDAHARGDSSEGAGGRE